MIWFSVLRFLTPAVLVLVAFGAAYQMGWKARANRVPAEIESAVSVAVEKEREVCTRHQQITGGINAELVKRYKDTADKYAALLGRLYDNTHDGSGSASTDSDSDHGTATGARLYYASPAGALPAIERARIATEQAEQLIGCQNYVRAVHEAKAHLDRER